MKKIIYIGITALVISGAIGVASAFEYSKKHTAQNAACACTDCICKDCKCTDCSNCNCDAGCCDAGSDCSKDCSKK